MKKLTLVVAMMAAMLPAFAQQAKVEKAQAALEKAIADSQDAKKSAKVATWIKLGQSYLNLYGAEIGPGESCVNIAPEFVQQMLADQVLLSEENVVVEGIQMVKKHYYCHNYYFDASGVLRIAEVCDPVCPDALPLAVEAYRKAAELDVKGSKSKEISDAYRIVNDKLRIAATNCYNNGDFEGSSKNFRLAVDAVASAPLNLIDTTSTYNAAHTAMLAGNTAVAKEYYKKSIDLKFADEGSSYSKLAAIAEIENNKDEQLKWLEEGFAVYPNSQMILFGLINFYRDNNLDTDKLFALIEQAKREDPNNPSLYVVEGDTREKLGQLDEAEAAYKKCIEINPEYGGGYIGLGFFYYNRASSISTEMMDVDLREEAKLDAMAARLKEYLKMCIEPLQKVVELSPENLDPALRGLKSACFQLRYEDEKYMDLYNKYKDELDALNVQ